MSPILIRPVREQLEHDRLIRHLATKYKKKYEVSVNVGDEQVAPVKIGALTLYPDVVWTDGKRLMGLAEVETSESVNNLEAMAQWVHFSRAKVPFHLYIPVQGYDATRRLCDANQAKVSEIWTYRASLDGFDLVKVYADASAPVAPPPQPKKAVKPEPAAAVAKPAVAKPAVAKPAPARPAASKPAAKVAKPAAKASKPAPKAKAAKPAAKPVKSAKGAAKSKAPARKPAPKAAAKKPAPKKKAAAGRGR